MKMSDFNSVCLCGFEDLPGVQPGVQPGRSSKQVMWCVISVRGTDCQSPPQPSCNNVEATLTTRVGTRSLEPGPSAGATNHIFPQGWFSLIHRTLETDN